MDFLSSVISKFEEFVEFYGLCFCKIYNFIYTATSNNYFCGLWIFLVVVLNLVLNIQIIVVALCDFKICEKHLSKAFVVFDFLSRYNYICRLKLACNTTIFVVYGLSLLFLALCNCCLSDFEVWRKPSTTFVCYIF